MHGEGARALGGFRHALGGEALEHGQLATVLLRLAPEERFGLGGIDEVDEERPQESLVAGAATRLDVRDPPAQLGDAFRRRLVPFGAAGPGARLPDEAGLDESSKLG